MKILPQVKHGYWLAFVIIIAAIGSVLIAAVSASRKRQDEAERASVAPRRHDPPRTTGGPTIYLSDPVSPVVTHIGEQSVVDALRTRAAQPLSMITSDLAAGSATAPCTVAVQGTILETPPAQPLGGALNSSMTVTFGTPLAPGASVNLQFRLGGATDRFVQILLQHRSVAVAGKFFGYPCRKC